MLFVYRSHYEGPLSKRVCRLPDDTVLDWFRRGWVASDPAQFADAEVGEVYGLDSIFEAAQQEKLPLPQTIDELRAQLEEHLYVEGDEDCIRLDDHSLRVWTDDDEVELAYFFFDDHIVAAQPDRLAYLLHEPWPLPDEVGPPGRFDAAVPLTLAAPAGSGEENTYAVLLTYYGSDSLARLRPLVFPGVGLPGLASHLRRTHRSDRQEWPVELKVLWALVAPDEETVGPALQRCNRWAGFNLNALDPWVDLPDDHEAAHPAALQLVANAEFTDGRNPEASLLHVTDNSAQLAMHCDETFGYQQWYLFDTIWAASHPDLAQSLLRYANHWDPLGN